MSALILSFHLSTAIVTFDHFVLADFGMVSLESSFVLNIALLASNYEFQAVVSEMLIKIFPQ